MQSVLASLQKRIEEQRLAKALKVRPVLAASCASVRMGVKADFCLTCIMQPASNKLRRVSKDLPALTQNASSVFCGRPIQLGPRIWHLHTLCNSPLCSVILQSLLT